MMSVISLTTCWQQIYDPDDYYKTIENVFIALLGNRYQMVLLFLQPIMNEWVCVYMER